MLLSGIYGNRIKEYAVFRHILMAMVMHRNTGELNRTRKKATAYDMRMLLVTQSWKKHHLFQDKSVHINKHEWFNTFQVSATRQPGHQKILNFTWAIIIFLIRTKNKIHAPLYNAH